MGNPDLVTGPASRRSSEKPDIVLAAEDHGAALAALETIQWGQVVAIVVESPSAISVAGLPTVVGAAGIMGAVQDGVLVLIDAGRGIVWVDPDPPALAQFTLEHDRVAPRKRIHLDSVNLPAATVDGVTIYVSCAVCDAGAVEEFDAAIEAGADAIEVDIPVEFDVAIYRSRLARALELSGGKPLVTSWQVGAPMLPLLEACADADITLVADSSAADPVEVMAALHQTVASAEVEGENGLLGSPRFASYLDIGDESALTGTAARVEQTIERLATQGTTRIYAAIPAISPAMLNRLAVLAAAAAPALMPLFVHAPAPVNADSTEQLTWLIGAGATGLFACTPVETIALKGAVRELDTAACRERVRELLNGMEEDTE
jgi:hypothetical protein